VNFGVFAFQAVPDAPRPGGGEQVAPTPGGDSGTSAPSSFSLITPLLILVPFILILFLQSRSQQKKTEATISALKKGDRVITQSGLVGRLLSIEGRYAKLERPPSGMKVTILRSGLLGRDTEADSSSTTTTAEPTSEKPKS
jgi:preprotein translocase subunit YajC